MPADFTFLQVFDCFFKVHKVFHIHYHPQIKNLMSFIDYYIFKNSEGDANVTTKMREVAKKIFKQ